MNRNVGFIIPSLKNGGAERVLSTISTNLDEEINQVIFTWNGREKDYEFNGKIVGIEIKNSKNLLKNIFVLYKRVKEIKKYKKIYNIDTCISHLEGPNIVNILSKGREKVIITVHNFQSKERKGIYGYIFRFLIKVYYNKADKIVTVSKLIKNDLIENFNIDERKIEVIYNPFNCSKIEKLSNEELSEEYKEIFKNPTIINVGRLTEQKGQWHLIKAFSELKKSEESIKLVILGQGELEEPLKNLVEKLGLKKDIFFLGFQKNPFKFISKAKIFALTSLYEGFPMCIAEAMACGTPVISVDCKSGPREMLSNSNYNYEASDIQYEEYGILTPKFGDSEKYNSLTIEKEEEYFSSALKYLINDKEKLESYKVKGKEKVKEFDINKIIYKWIKVI